jgi:hypothetical protein
MSSDNPVANAAGEVFYRSGARTVVRRAPVP